MTHPQHKIISLSAAAQWREELRVYGGTLAVTNGCFDVLHRGHLELLIAAREQADALLVLVNSDASVRALKGPERPINHELDRALALACMSMVDRVVIFDAPRCDYELAALAPTVYTKSIQYQGRQDPAELAALQACKARLHFVLEIPGHSSSNTLAKLKGTPTA